MLQKLNNQGYTFTDDGRVIVVDKYGAVKRLTNLSLTTIGTTGPATLIGNLLNIPDYSSALTGYVPTSRTLTINGTAYDLSADRSWSVGTVTSVGATGGTGISISGSPITGSGSLTITNTAPDQTVVLSSGTGISTSGTYPNFTITNTSPDQIVALTSSTGISVSGTYPNFTITNTSPAPANTITGLGTTNYVSKFTASGTIGNSQIFDNGTNVGIGTTSINSSLEIYKASGPNYIYLTNGTSGTNNGVVLRYNSVDYMGMIGTFTTGELKVGGFNAGGYFMTFYSNNSERMRLTPSGRLLIGTTTESTFLLDVNGTAAIRGNFDLLGKLDSYIAADNTATIRTTGTTTISRLLLQGGNGTTSAKYNYISFVTSDATTQRWDFGQYGNNNLTFRNVTGSASVLSITTSNNVLVGTTTDGGQKLQVIGSSFFSGNIGGYQWNYDQGNGRWVFGTSTNQSSRYFTLINIWSTTAATLAVRNIASQTANSLQIENSSSTVLSGFDVNGGLFIGSTSLNASAVLEATSTTKGFLPPRMTGAQAEAIGTPAAGLLVYANNGNGVTITSTGWWGYNGTTWVKLN